MKAMERIIKDHITMATGLMMDPLQFAYQAGFFRPPPISRILLAPLRTQTLLSILSDTKEEGNLHAGLSSSLMLTTNLTCSITCCN
ncbi:unnamed protein product [Boreogadus saida]